jgi:hypothetical protein
MSDPDDESIEHLAAFEARFPLDAFEPIARTLGKNVDQASLSALRHWLLPYFDFYADSTGKEPSRAERIQSLEAVRDAATTLLKFTAIGWLTRPTIEAVSNQQFTATVRRLAEEAQAGIQKLRKLGRTGRPAKNTGFRDLVPHLVHVYEHLTKTKAGKPYWLPDSRAYGGAFYLFAVAIWRCIRDCLPEARNALPKSKMALAEELKDHWSKDHNAKGEKVL